MGELVLLVVAAAWAAVLIPPLLRSRIENRPNSSVTDFRRQLNRLQSTVPSRASGSMRGMARPLAPSPLQRPAAAGRPGMQAAQLRRNSAGRSHGARAAAATLAPVREQAAPRRRSHGDPTGGQPRPRQAGPPPGACVAPCGRRVRDAASSALEHAVHARARHRQHAVPGRHHQRAGDALPVRDGLPGAVRIPVPAVAGAPSARPRRGPRTGCISGNTSPRRRYDSVVRYGAVAQLVERDNRTVEARGSIPLSSTEIGNTQGLR